MNSRLLAVLIIFPIWLTLVLIFRKHRQWLFYYLIAAFGLTLQLVLLVEYLGWDQILINVASFHVSLVSQYIFHLPVELLTNGRFQIIMSDGSSSILKVNRVNVAKLVHEKKIKAVQIGKFYRIRENDFNAFLTESEV